MAETLGNQNFGSIPSCADVCRPQCSDQMRRCGKREKIPDMEGGGELAASGGRSYRVLGYLGTWYARL